MIKRIGRRAWLILAGVVLGVVGFSWWGGVELAETLELILREVQPDRVWLLTTSMGAQFVVDGFAVLSQPADMADVGTEIEDVIITAPDIDADEFDQQFKGQITALARDALAINRRAAQGRN